jgi:hypothetical protein
VSGLHGNEQVILNPQDSIVDGAPVRIVPRKADSGAGSEGAAGAAGAAAGNAASSPAAQGGARPAART